MVRVIAGSAKGRRLVTPKGAATRPTSDLVREAVFNTLAPLVDLAGAAVADLFAGSGALGIEALSRGAASCVFVDSDRAAVEAVRANLRATGLAGGEVVQSDVLRWAASARAAGRGFDVVLADPPYAFADDGWRDLAGGLDADLFVVESDREPDLGDAWRVLRTKRYGSTVVTLVTPWRRP
jgi:16S rRNA (guanine966-N2)-methyltransferase